MCGIAGILDRRGQPIDVGVLREMTRSLKHRGPDDEGHVLVNPATGAFFDVERSEGAAPGRTGLGLGNRRLSIIDLSPASRQPISNEDGSVWITYNGEIYNYLELAADLRARGHVFRSGSDTEVIVHAYEEYGVDCVERLNGMWAFALWDGRRRRLFCSRDRFGEKPFYYFGDEATFVFASEIKALLRHPRGPRAPNYRAVFRYVASGYGFTDTSGETFFEGIRQLPAGHSMTVDGSGLSLWRYWQLRPETSPRPRPAAEVERQFRDLFADSVRLRLRSDVPVGFCLSGGLDSSSIVCTASTMNAKVTTFSSCAEDARFDERRWIESVVEKTGALAHFVFPEGRALLDLVPRMLQHQDEPWSTPNIFAHWHLMECARQHGVPVLLNGHGGDETLAGYYPHFTAFHADLLKGLRLATLARELRAHGRIHGFPLSRELGRVLRALGGRGRRRLGIGSDRRRAYPHLDRGFVERHRAEAPPLPSSAGLLRDELRTGLEVSPLPAWLRYEDRNSMAFSVETRQPFLDHRLVEFLFTVPDDLKIRDGMSKFLLRRALGDVLPPEVRGRTLKMGFRTPAAVWFREDVLGPVREILTSSAFRSRGIFDAGEVERRLDAHARGAVDRTFALWSWVNLELWFRQFFG